MLLIFLSKCVYITFFSIPPHFFHLELFCTYNWNNNTKTVADSNKSKIKTKSIHYQIRHEDRSTSPKWIMIFRSNILLVTNNIQNHQNSNNKLIHCLFYQKRSMIIRKKRKTHTKNKSKVDPLSNPSRGSIHVTEMNSDISFQSRIMFKVIKTAIMN